MRSTAHRHRFLTRLWLLLPVVFLSPLRGQESSGASPRTDGSSPVLRERLEMIEKNVLGPAIEARKDILSTADQLERSAEELRQIWERLETEAAQTKSNERRSLLEKLDARFAGALVEVLVARGGLDEGGAQAAAREAVATARALHRQRRAVNLHETIKCWCPKEKWTRTLQGCFENCANDQKGRIQEWLEGGYTNDEIRSMMVSAAGTEDVLFKPRARLASVIPYAIFGVAFVLVAWILLRVRRASRASREIEKRDEAPVDPEWDARLESELKEMED